MFQDGITVELFEAHGLSYEQRSAERILLKKLLLLPSKASNHLAGQVKFTMKLTGEDGENNKLKKLVVVALLDYTVDVPFSLIKALNDQKVVVFVYLYFRIWSLDIQHVLMCVTVSKKNNF